MGDRINYEKLEHFRKDISKTIKRIILLDLILFIPLNLWAILSSIIYVKEIYLQLFIVINMMNLVIITYYLSYKLKDYKKKVRNNSLPKLFHKFGDEFRHDYEEFFEQSIEETRLYNRIDQLTLKNIITGNINYANITRADVKLGNITYFSNRRRKYVPLCHGHWYILDVNQKFNGITHIKQKKKNYIFKDYTRPKVDDSPFDEVTIHNEQINNQFEVFSTDVKQAGRALTPGLMKLIEKLNERYPKKVIVALVGHHVHVGIHHYMKKFNPPVFKEITKDTLEEQIIDLKILGDIINELHNIDFKERV